MQLVDPNKATDSRDWWRNSFSVEAANLPCLYVNFSQEGFGTKESKIIMETIKNVLNVSLNYFAEFNVYSFRLIRDFYFLFSNNNKFKLQLLDEMIDNGFPLTTEPNMLRGMIEPPNIVSKMLSVVTGNSSNVSNTLPGETSFCVPWRTTGLKRTSNEVYFDLVEEMDAIINRYAFFSFAPSIINILFSSLTLKLLIVEILCSSETIALPLVSFHLFICYVPFPFLLWIVCLSLEYCYLLIF